MGCSHKKWTMAKLGNGSESFQCRDCGEWLPREKFDPSAGTLSANAKPDPVNHPSHYTQGGIECIDAIKAALTPEEFRGFCKGNTLKYIWREKYKNGDQDLSKGIFYQNLLLKKES